MCDNCNDNTTAEERIRAFAEETPDDMPIAYVSRDGDVMFKMTPKYLSRVVDHDGNAYMYLDLDSVTALMQNSISAVVGIDVITLVDAVLGDSIDSMPREDDPNA